MRNYKKHIARLPNCLVMPVSKVLWCILNFQGQNISCCKEKRGHAQIILPPPNIITATLLD